MKSRKILVVDDELDILNLLADILTKKGWTVLKAKSGAEGLEAFKQNPEINVVLTDILCARAGSYDGISLARDICGLADGMPIVFMSGNLGSYDHDDLGEYSSFFIAKPFTAKQLTDLLDAVCEEYGIEYERQFS